MIEKYIPLDKSWTIRCICLDIINEYNDIDFNDTILSDDIQQALTALKTWKDKKNIFVGESATLYRFLKFINWKQNSNKNLIISGTLKNRKVCDDSTIINLSLDELLKLDNNTSQWASAAYLCGNRELPETVPFKLQTTIDACNHWEFHRDNGEAWIPLKDKTISNQVDIFLQLMNGNRPTWFPVQSEDYCFARVFNYINADEGLKLWPSLCNHESNRIIEMESAIKLFQSDLKITSKDHRVIQALVMYSYVNKVMFNCDYPHCVNKSWPQFWNFIQDNT